MIAASFDEANMVLDAPKDMSPEECASLSAMQGQWRGMPCVVSCWKVTREELEEIARTGRIWLVIVGETMPPVMVEGAKPF